MIAWGKSEDGSDDVAVFTGIADWDGATLTMRREPESASFVVDPAWLPRIKPVPEELKSTLLDAEYYFSVTVGNVEDASGFESTGLRWPGDE